MSVKEVQEFLSECENNQELKNEFVSLTKTFNDNQKFTPDVFIDSLVKIVQKNNFNCSSEDLRKFFLNDNKSLLLDTKNVSGGTGQNVSSIKDFLSPIAMKGDLLNISQTTVPSTYDNDLEDQSTQNEKFFTDTKSHIDYLLDKKNKTAHIIKCNSSSSKMNLDSIIKYRYNKKYDVTSIREDAFNDNNEITEITISDSIKSIGDRAFMNCTNLHTVNVGNSLLSIGYGTFFNCSSLRCINIPDSTIKIGPRAFMNCRNLRSIHIGQSVALIGEMAFESCENLKTVFYFGSTMIPDNKQFYKCNDIKVYVTENYNGKFFAGIPVTIKS